MILYRCFDDALQDTRKEMEVNTSLVEAQRWQSRDLPKIPHVQMREAALNYSFQVALRDRTDLGHWRADIDPNLPWADTAFEERVEGIPWNPGTAWETWPGAQSAADFKTDRFSHSYAERYWPLYAGKLTDEQWAGDDENIVRPNKGIRFNYGDLHSVVNRLHKDPLTRQAYLPVWFPEDTGAPENERVPCSLGYHFIFRDNFLHITYYIRSCDYVRHLRDDLYMTLRLLIWVRAKLIELDFGWNDSQLGNFTFHCVSLHMFQGDWQKEFGQETP